uniref:(northern house mosquito) hypothetical protein n=1 Tax=Culex pipiens TaxID=7175 RepID=A0A8D8PDP8_CULPI
MKSSRISSMKSHTRAGRRSSLLVRRPVFVLVCLTVRSVRFVRPLVACEPPFRCSSSFDWSANLPGERTHGTSLLLAIDSGTCFRFHDTSNALWLLFEPQPWPLAGANLAGAGRRNNHNNTPCPCTISIDKERPPESSAVPSSYSGILLGRIVVSSSPADQFGLAALLAPFFSLPPPPASLPGVLCNCHLRLGATHGTPHRNSLQFEEISRHQANLPLTTAVGRQCPHRFLLLHAHTHWFFCVNPEQVPANGVYGLSRRRRRS